MKQILVLGAGLSASSLIDYLLKNSTENNWKIVVGDVSKEIAESKIAGHKNGTAIKFDINDEQQKEDEISKADLVVSLLPAFMHPIVAKSCLKYKKHMVTASYVSDEMKALNEEAKQYGLIFLNEIGVDPGIDHMSAMEVINKIKEEGGELEAFYSFTGGLVAPKYDNNPWNYKFTWNPRNVVLAGQGTAKYKEQGSYKYVPYNQLFMRTNRFYVDGYGEFEGYPNRDSLKYRDIYNINEIPTILRGTLRRPGYCKAWNVFVQLGMTDDTYIVENSENTTYREFINSYLKYDPELSVEDKLAQFIGEQHDSNVMYRLRWLGIFDDKKIGLKNATPAQILQNLLVEKWVFEEDDKDLIVMQHQFEYKIDNKRKKIISSLAVEGKDHTHTAMAITVGIPAAIGVKMILNGTINIPGVHVPVIKEIYEPILKELEDYGIKFTEKSINL